MTDPEPHLGLIEPAELIRRALEVPPLPASVGRLAALVADERSDLGEIVKVITFDPALTGALLRRANSASSARSQPIGTIKDAVVRLGTSTVLALAASSCVARRMKTALPEYGLGEGALWTHSVAAAVAAETLKTRSKVRLPGDVVTSALLHDLGKLVMARFLSPDVLRLLRLAEADGHQSRMRAEVELLEVHHGELGALIVGQWGLPDSIRRAVQYHHAPDPADNPAIHAVYLADRVGHELLGEAVPDEPEARVAFQVLALDPTKHADLVAAARTRYDELAVRYQD